MKLLLTSALVFAVTAWSAADAQTVTIKKNGDKYDVTIGGEAFATYNTSKELPKPFFSPVKGTGGSILTRSIPDQKEHPHHKGIWVAVDEINEVKHWAEKGKIVNASVNLMSGSAGDAEVSEYWKNALQRYAALCGAPLAGSSRSSSADSAEGNPARMRVVNHWLDTEGEPVVTETTTISIYANRLMTYAITFSAGDEQVTFGDTKEGMLGFRMVDSMRENEGGQVRNSDGLEGSKACWGKVADWVDYYGQADGKTHGVTLMDHPLNFRRSRYHVRNYGLFSMSPFGERAYTGGKRPADHLILMPGGSVTLRYGLYIHDGDTNAGNVDGTYLQFLTSWN